jgi:hypothetical protein
MNLGPGSMQSLNSLPAGYAPAKLICCYVNATSSIQVARITNVPNWYFERVVFPGQRLMFEAVPSACLEIHTGMMASAILTDTIPCHSIQVSDDNVMPLEAVASDSSSLRAS